MHNKKSFLMTLLISLALITTSCSKPESEPFIEPINSEAFRFSSINDISDDDGIVSYKMYAPYTDTFEISSSVTELAVYKDKELLIKGSGELKVDLIKDEIYTLKIVTEPNSEFKTTVKALNNLITYPYELLSPTNITYSDNEEEVTVPALIDYKKREGGTYIYSNNPEMIPANSVNTAFIQDKGLKGDVFMTFEHANWTSSHMYLGYELKNETNQDVYITVTNIGYQNEGTWFGQLAWYDYYNTKFELPEDYFDVPNVISKKYAHLDYAYQNYKPRIYQPTTYRLPAGEKFFVLGGTTKGTYNKINVGNTANKKVASQRCANGNVRFLVTNGEVTGTMYSYTGHDKLIDITEAVGYKVGGYSQQYLGIAHHAGVIDAQINWEFNDSTKAGRLPVTYTNIYDSNVPKQTTPYKEYNNTEHTFEERTNWMTHLNPQNDHQAVGMDMVDFICTDENGNEVVIDNYHADGGGNPANTANWMIEYQEHFTFVNSGNSERTIKVCYKDHGTLTMIVRDTITGELIETYYTCGQAGDATTYAYDVVVPAHESVQVSLCYSLVACSYGSVIHWVTID